MEIKLHCPANNCKAIITEWNFSNVTCPTCGREWETDYETDRDDDILGPWITGPAKENINTKHYDAPAAPQRCIGSDGYAHEVPAPTVPERGAVNDQWGYRQLADDEWEVENDIGVIVAVTRRELWAQWITEQHNQHSTLVAQRERLLVIVNSFGWHSQNGKYSCWCHVKSDFYAKHTEQCQSIRAVLTTSEQEGTRN